LPPHVSLVILPNALYQNGVMKLIAIVFSLAATAMFLSACGSTGGGTSNDGGPVGAEFADPDNLQTQERMQDLHSDVLRQNL
jgi:predicted small secreted protein